MDSGISTVILALEVVLCVTLWGPQPAFWLWVGSHVDYQTGSVTFGIVAAFAGMLATLMGTLVLLKQLDHWWKLTRRASGHAQKGGVLERIFVTTLVVAGSAFGVWFLLIEGPGSQVFSPQA